MGRNQIQKNNHTVKAAVEVVVIKEDDAYVAYCPALDLSSYGDTEKKALHGFGTALNIFFEETQRKGSLEKVLLRLGWSLQQLPEPNYAPPKLDRAELHRLYSTKKVVTEEIAVPA